MSRLIELLQPDYEACQIEHDCEAEPEECWHTPKWWTCRYYQTVERSDVATEPCSFGCWEEPNCVTGQPTEGWPTDDESSAPGETPPSLGADPNSVVVSPPAPLATTEPPSAAGGVPPAPPAAGSGIDPGPAPTADGTEPGR